MNLAIPLITTVNSGSYVNLAVEQTVLIFKIKYKCFCHYNTDNSNFPFVQFAVVVDTVAVLRNAVGHLWLYL